MDAELEITEDLVAQIDKARALYVLHGACLLFSAGLFNLAPLIANYRRRRSGAALVQSHHKWMIRSFWLYAALFVGGLLTLRFTVGGLVILFAWFMLARNLVYGYRALNETEPAPFRH